MNMQKGVLTIVDLAGREAMQLTSLDGGDSPRTGDVASLNRDLLMLGSTIKGSVAYTSDKPVYVPFRNTKLTSILSQALNGNEDCLIVGCICLARGVQSENTLHTLDFCYKAKQLSDACASSQSLVRSWKSDQCIEAGIKTNSDYFHIKEVAEDTREQSRWRKQVTPVDITPTSVSGPSMETMQSPMDWTHQSGFSALTDINTLPKYSQEKEQMEAHNFYEPNTLR